MATTAEDNKRIARNTVYLYLRMLFKVLVTFYTSRVLLEALGVQDFGIYNVVAGVVALFAFVNSSMTISVQRYLSFAMGQGSSQEGINRIFSMAVWIHLLIAVVLVVLSEAVGALLFKYYLNIPPGRMEAAYTLFHFSIATYCMSITQVPHIALLISYEKMDAYAYIGIVDVVLRLLVVYLLSLSSYDKLPFYGFLLFCVLVLTTVLYVVCSRRQIRVVRFRMIWDRKIFRSLVGFASWSAFGEIAWAGTGQGVNIVLNVFFSPVVNAARAIAQQVIAGITQFVMSFQTAINPQIIKSYASGELQRMMSLTNKGVLFSYYLLLLMGLPVLVSMDYILTLWLKNPPAQSSAFCSLAIVGAMMDALSNLFSTVAKAYGRIRNYQLCVSCVLFLNLPLSYAVLKLGAPPSAVYGVYISVSVGLLALRLYLLRRMVGYDVRLFFRTVFSRVLLVTALAVPLPVYVKSCCTDSFLSFLLVSAAAVLSVLAMVYLAGLTPHERLLVNNKLRLILRWR